MAVETGDTLTLTPAEVEAMHWEQVTSSNVAAVAHQLAPHLEATGNLFVRFHNGGLYRYDSVPRGDYTALLEANRNSESVGQLLHDTVKTMCVVHPVEVAGSP